MNLPRKSEAELQRELMVEALADPMLFFRTFLPHWFALPLPWAHRGVVAILLRQTDFLLNFGKEVWPGGEYEWTRADLDKILEFFVWREDPLKEDSPAHPLFHLEEAPDGTLSLHLEVAQFTQVVWPRGFGKTTLINATNIMKVVYRLRRFIVYLSETDTHASMQLENIKRELEANTLLIQVFGKQKPERTDPQKWQEGFCETLQGVILTSRGRGGQVRGMLVNNERPDDIVIDDVEDEESVATDTQRKKTLAWFKAAVEPALNQIKGNGSVTMIGTLLHRDALIPTLMGDENWISIVFGAIAPDGTALWENYMTLAALERKKKSFARVGMLEQFYREFLSRLHNSATAKFPGPFKIIYMQRAEFASTALVIDPAISEKENADFCAFGVTGMTVNGFHHVLDVYGRKGMNPREQVDKYFELHFKWDVNRHGVEAIAYQAALIHLLREEMFRKAKTFGQRAYFEIEPIRHPPTKSKLARVEGALAPRYSAGYISHQAKFPELETQLLEWPTNKRDFPDVVAMCITLLDPFAALAYNPTEEGEEGEKFISDPLAKDIYEPLERRYTI